MTFHDLDAALARYKDVATTYNQLMLEDFIHDVRVNFKPLPDSWDDPDGNPREDVDEVQEEGYTVEGAIARFVYSFALYEHRFEELGKSANPSAAENASQVFHKSPESLIDELPVLSEPPYTDSEITTFRLDLTGFLTRQAEKSGFTDDFDLPEEFFHYMKLARGVHGIGLPSPHDSWQVISDIWLPLSSFAADPASLHSRIEYEKLEAKLVWQIGSQQNNTRQVWYCYSRTEGKPEEKYQWRIVENYDVETYVFQTLTDYLNTVTAKLQDGIDVGRESWCWQWDWAVLPWPRPE